MLRDALEEKFLFLVDVDEAGQRAGERKNIRLTQLGGRHGARVIHRHAAKNHRIPMPDLEEMDAAGLVAMTRKRDGTADLRVTAEGHEHAARIRAGSKASASVEGGYMDWDAQVLPVLQAVYAVASANPGPMGVNQGTINRHLGRENDDPRTSQVLAELVTGEYLEQTAGAWQATGPLKCKLAPKGLQIVANWPSGSGEAVSRALLRALDERIEESDSDEERTKLEAFRSSAREVGVSAIAQIIAKVSTGAI